MTKALIPKLVASCDAHVINVISIAGSEVYDNGAGRHACDVRLALLTSCVRIVHIREPTVDQATPAASTRSEPSARPCAWSFTASPSASLTCLPVQWRPSSALCVLRGTCKLRRRLFAVLRVSCLAD